MSNLRTRNASLVLAGVCFGTTGTAQALGPKGVSPLAVGSARLIIGALLLYIFHIAIREASSRISRQDLILGAIGVALYQITFFSAVKSTGVAIGTVTALGSAPALTGVVAYLINREKPTRRWLVATIITSLGIVVLSTAKNSTSFNITGFLLALGAGASYSLFAVVSKRALASGVKITDAMFRIFTLAAVLSFPLLFVGDLNWIVSAKGSSMILWLGLVPTAFAYMAYAYGLEKVRASTASTLILAEPATATVLAAAVLGETINGRGWIGIVVVIVGLLYLSL
ncbi:MAG: EamA family transporter [Candidatus Nanopelagicaceae bacterium]|nr:EamA family transporter [Candidatus Nanopelagicaceae bacterium]